MTGDASATSMGIVTDLTAVVSADIAELAVRDAEAAATAAGVTIREVTALDELAAIVRLYATIWGRQGNPPVTVELLRAFTKAGNYTAGAFDGAQLVGACVGFFGAPAEDALHSHIAGVGRAALGRGVGFALKLHQRGWALRHGVSEIVWTFDPLVSRNAYFNLVKLAARPAEYLPNFYGAMRDEINGMDDSDRLLVRWRLRDPRVVTACAGAGKPASAAAERAAGAVTALGITAAGAPEPGPVSLDGVASLNGVASLVAVPPDIEALRGTDPALARRWRRAVRHALTDRGAAITGFDRTGWYVVGPAAGAPEVAP
jgi:predicted GNAT superfamily acetyltransferase